MSKLIYADTTSISLESQLERLALEADVISNVIATFKSILPNLVSKINETVEYKETNEINMSQLAKEASVSFASLDKKLKYANYLNFSKTLVSVPEGFKGNLLEFIILLNKSTPIVYTTGKELLSEYKTNLSTFITNKEDKISLKDNTPFFNKLKATRTNILDEINKFFTTNNGLSKQYLKDTIDRFNDLEKLVVEVKNLDKKHVAESMKDMHVHVKECTDLLNIIIDQIDKEGTSKVSGPAAVNISQGAYEVAKYVEFMAAYRYKTMQAIYTVDKLISQLDNIIK